MNRIESRLRWYSLLERIARAHGVTISDAQKHTSYVKVMARYAEIHRAYHNKAHIDDCLLLFDEVRHLALEPDAVEMAIWLHDVIYDPRSKTNEEDSIVFAHEIMSELGLPARFQHRVARRIYPTKHVFALTNPDYQLIADIDLASLGYTWEKFKKNGEDIRFEYSFAPWNDYVTGRNAILRSFLDREHIYYHQWFRDRYETQAQANIKRAINDLSSSIAAE